MCGFYEVLTFNSRGKECKNVFNLFIPLECAISYNVVVSMQSLSPGIYVIVVEGASEDVTGVEGVVPPAGVAGVPEPFRRLGLSQRLITFSATAGVFADAPDDLLAEGWMEVAGGA